MWITSLDLLHICPRRPLFTHHRNTKHTSTHTLHNFHTLTTHCRTCAPCPLPGIRKEWPFFAGSGACHDLGNMKLYLFLIHPPIKCTSNVVLAAYGVAKSLHYYVRTNHSKTNTLARERKATEPRTCARIASGVIMQKLMLVVAMLLPQPSCECIGTFSRTAVEFTAIQLQPHPPRSVPLIIRCV